MYKCIDYWFLMIIVYEILEVFLFLVSMFCLYCIVNGNCIFKYDKSKYILKLKIFLFIIMFYFFLVEKCCLSGCNKVCMIVVYY